MKKTMRLQFAVFVVVGTAASVNADVVTDWNDAALQAIRLEKTSPPVASRNLAMLHAAIYDAVNGINPKFEPYLVRIQAPDRAHKKAAACAAAHQVLIKLFPGKTPNFNALLASTLATIPKSPHKVAGMFWGHLVAHRILASRANDGASAVVPPPMVSGPGAWEPTPPAYGPFLLPQWGFVTPFAMKDSLHFMPPGPPPLNSARYAADFNEVKALGGAVSSMRTPEQTEIAIFWADGSGTETPPGHWNHLAQQVSADQGNSLEENARMFALLNIAMADAAICSWNAKYVYCNWRPVTAIQQADIDGNPRTEPDPNWNSLVPSPPFPDYVSGHSTFSGAAAAVLARFYQADDIAFVTGSDALPGVFRNFQSFSEAAGEAASSRIYCGIHFRFASDDGLEAGRAIGEYTFSHFMQPNPDLREDQLFEENMENQE